jgi:hypothetical protein
MNIRYGKVNTNISLRGHRFSAGSIIKIWNTGSATSIQPLTLPTPYHEVLWYSVPDLHVKHINPLSETEEGLVLFGILT